MTSSPTFDFGSYRLDPAKRLLLREGEPMPLAPKAFDTLLFLVEHRERVVSKDELLRALWPDTVVEEASLSQQIFLLRKALGDGSDESTYIATVPRRGYRFVAPVAEAPSGVSAESSGPARWIRQRRAMWAAAAIAIAVAIVVAAVGARLRSPASMPSVTRLAVLPPAGTISWGSPVVSPDGRSVAFRAQIRDGRDLLWVRPFDSPNAIALVGTEGADFPFWSPDSRWLAFFGQGKLKRIGAGGGIVQVLCDASAGRGGAWNRDDVIVFAPDTRSVLYRVSAAGGSPVPVTTLGKSPVERGHRFPHFLADGRHFIYLTYRNDYPPALVIGSLDASGGHDVLAGTRLREAYAPAGFLVFRREGPLVAQALDTSRFRLLGGFRAIVEDVASADVNGHENFSVSDNGVLAYLGGSARTSELIWYDRAGRRTGAIGAPGNYLQVSLSRDASRVAVVRGDRQTWQREIWVIDSSRGTMSRVTAAPPVVDDPVWSPDGRQIAFASMNQSVQEDVHIKAWGDTGASEIVLSSGGNNFVYDWSPDGQYVLFGREEEPGPIKNLWIVPVSGHRSATPFLKTSFQKTAARFSPNGRWIAYSSNESGSTEVYVTSFPKADIKLQVSTGGGEQPVWRRDGRELFFVSADGRLMASDISRDGLTIGIPRPLFRFPASTSGQPDPWRWAYAVASDGERFLINTPRDEDLLPINVVFNWTSLLTTR